MGLGFLGIRCLLLSGEVGRWNAVLLPTPRAPSPPPMERSGLRMTCDLVPSIFKAQPASAWRVSAEVRSQRSVHKAVWVTKATAVPAPPPSIDSQRP